MRVRKGVEEFLRAMAMVRERVPGAEAVVVGEVALDDDLERLVDAEGLRPHLHLLGPRNDMPEVLSAFDLFVLSSHDEGMSNAVLEAMAMQKAVVATDVGGTGEVIQHGRSGLLVPAKDPVPLADAMARLLAAPSEAAMMGRRAREIVVERFSARAMVRQMEELYTQLLRERGAGAPAGAPVQAAQYGDSINARYLSGTRNDHGRVRRQTDPDGSVAGRPDLPRHVVALPAARDRRARPAANRLPVHLARALRSLRSADARPARQERPRPDRRLQAQALPRPYRGDRLQAHH
jgi:hypothetical protein